MIFSDQETAKEIRQEAEKQIIDFITKQNLDLLDAMNIILKNDPHGIDEDSIRNNAEAQYRRNFPNLPATLLFKSGMIHAKPKGDNVYPVVLYYDNDTDGYQMKVSQAMNEVPGRLIGGLLDGRIHT